MNRLFELRSEVARWPRIPISVLIGCCVGTLLAISIAIVVAYMSTQARQIIETQVYLEADQRVERLRDAVEGRLDEIERLARTVRAGLNSTSDPAGRDALLSAFLGSRDTPMALRYGDRIGIRDLSGSIRLTAARPRIGPAYTDGWSIAKTDGALTFNDSTKGEDAVSPALEIMVYAKTLSKDIASVSDLTRAQAFVLADRETVIAHSAWAGSGSEPTETPTLKTTGDLDLRNIWARSEEFRSLPHGNHLDRGHQGMRVYVYKAISRPNINLTVGFHARASLFGAAFMENTMLALAALVALIASVILGVLLSISLSRPIQRLAMAARQIEGLSLERAPRLERSVMKELDDANSAILSAFRAIGAFAKFVPQDVVRQAMRDSAEGESRAEVRNMTIMFTDLAGFTSIATHRSPDVTAALLNEHFEMVTSIIDAEGGTVDKFLGDGVMAFWGAPGHQLDHAERAMRAARAIADTFSNSADEMMRLRIGVCTGDVLVGITGSRVRMNYTVIGDPVNIAARMQELGKEVAPKAHAVALASGSTVEAAHMQSDWTNLGQRTLRGRDEPTDVYFLAAGER